MCLMIFLMYLFRIIVYMWSSSSYSHAQPTCLVLYELVGFYFAIKLVHIFSFIKLCDILDVINVAVIALLCAMQMQNTVSTLHTVCI